MIAPILIFAVGNESRGDDALGPLLLRQLESWLIETGNAAQFEVLEEFQLQVEHAMDMKDRQLILFIDASINTRKPFSFYRAKTSDKPVLYSHALEPEALLNVYAQFYQESPPAVFILGICGEKFELGEGLSAHAIKRQLVAFEFSQQLLLHPDASDWDKFCTH